MLKKKMFLVAATALMAFSLAGCNSTTQGGSDQDYDQNTDVTKKDLVISVIGEEFGNWDWSTVKKHPEWDFVKTRDDGFEYTLTGLVITAGKQFKVALDHAWASSYGSNTVDLAASTKGFETQEVYDKKDNIVAAISGTYTVKFYPYFFLVDGVDNTLVFTKTA